MSANERQYKVGFIVAGDASGGIRALKDTREALNKNAQAAHKAEAANRDLSDSQSDLTESVKRYGGALLGGLGVGAVTAYVSSSYEMVTANVRAARSLGVSYAELQRYGQAARNAGLEQQEFTDALRDMSVRINEFAAIGTGEAADFFEQLNVDAAEFVGLSPDQQLIKVAEALDQVSTRGEKLVYLDQLMGDAGVALVDLLDDQAAGFKALVEEARKYGTILSDVDAVQVEDAGRAVEDLTSALGDAGSYLTAKLAPGIREFSAGLTDLLRDSGKVDAAMSVLMTTGEAVAVLYGSRLASSLAQSATARVNDTRAASAQAAAQLRVAETAQVEAQAVLRSAAVQAKAAKGTQLYAGAMQRAAAAGQAYRVATDQLTMAQQRYNAAAGVGARAVTGLKSAMAFLGGPTGVAVLAGYAIWQYIDSIETAEEKTERLAKEVDRLAAGLGNLSLGDIGPQMSTVMAQLTDAQTKLDDLKAPLEDGVNRFISAKGVDAFHRLNAAISDQEGEVEKLSTQYQALEKAAKLLLDAGLGNLFEQGANDAEELAKSQQELLDTLFPLKKEQREYNEQKAIFDKLVASGAIEDETEGLRQLQGQYELLYPKVAKQIKAEQDQADTRERNKKSTAALIKQLQFEKEVMGLSDRERVIRLNLQRAGVGLTGEEADKIRELTGAIYDQQMALEAQAAEADAYAQAWETATERIDTAFADAWKGAFDSFEDFSDQIKNAFKQLLAELIHQATTKKILISLGLGSSGGAFASGGSGISAGDLVGAAQNGFSLTDLMQGGGALAGINGTLWSGVGYAADFLTNIGFNSAANTMVSAAANMSQLPGGLAGGGLLTAAGGYVGGQAGNAIGEGLFGKEAEHSYGQIAGGTIGGIAGAASGAVMGMQLGAWAGPVGALIGAALGALADVAFGGDGKKRVSLGVHAAPDIRGRYRVGSDQAESGLEFTAISRRAGKKGDQAARDMMDAFMLMDSTMVAAAETLGQTVDLTEVSLTGKHVDAGHTGGAFFGSAKYNKVDSAQLEEAAGEFVTAWGDAVGGKFDETLDMLTAGLSMKEISDHAGGIISAVGLVGSATGDLKLVLDTFVPTLDDTKEVASDLPFWFGQLNKTVSAFPFADLIQEGEVAATTLTRLSLNLVGANEVINSLGMEVLALDEAGLRAADTLTGLFGGVDAFAAAANNYATAFMTDSERFVAFQDGMKKSFAELNAQLPETRREFQAMVEALDLADEAAQKQFAAYMALVPVMDEYFQALEQHQQLIGGLESGIKSLIDELYGTGSDLEQQIAEEKARIADQQRAADALYRTEQQRYRDALAAEKRLSDYVDSLQLGELSVLSPTQQLAEARAQFEAAVAAAQAGDTGAAQDATRIASSYLKIARDFYASSDDYRQIFLGVNQQLGGLAGQFAGTSAPEKATVGESDTLASLYEQLAEQQAQAEEDRRQLSAVDLAQALADLGLAKDLSIFELMDSFGIDLDALASDFGIDLDGLGVDISQTFGQLSDAFDLSFDELLNTFGVNFSELSDVLGGDINNLAEVTVGEFTRAADALGLNIIDLGELTVGEFADLADTLGVEITAVTLGVSDMATDMANRLGKLSKALGISSRDLLEKLGIEFGDLAKAIGVDIQNLDTTTAKALVDLGESLNLTNSELLGSLALEIDSLGGDMKAELEALGDAMGGLSNLELLEGMGQNLAGLAEEFGVDLSSLDVSMTDELRALGDVFNLAIGSLAEELDINLAVLPIAIQEAVGYEPPPEPAAPAYDYDTWADWLAAGVADGWTPDFTEAYNDWLADNPLNFSWGFGGFYAKGGIANEPSIFGEAGPEAAVPLPDGRTIPVTLSSPPVSTVASDELVADQKQLVQLVDELKAEVKQLREDNAAIAEHAAGQRQDAKEQAEKDAQSLKNTIKRDVNTRAVA